MPCIEAVGERNKPTNYYNDNQSVISVTRVESAQLSWGILFVKKHDERRVKLSYICGKIRIQLTRRSDVTKNPGERNSAVGQVT